MFTIVYQRDVTDWRQASHALLRGRGADLSRELPPSDTFDPVMGPCFATDADAAAVLRAAGLETGKVIDAADLSDYLAYGCSFIHNRHA